MSTEPWIYNTKAIDKKTNNDIEFKSVCIINKKEEVLATLNPEEIFETYYHIDINFIEKIRENLKKGLFDKRIKKIVKKELL